MAFIEIKDRFSLKSLQYMLKTTVESEQCAVRIAFFRQGEMIHSTARPFQNNLKEDKIKQLATTIHTFYKKEIIALFQSGRKMARNGADDAGLNLLARGLLKYGLDQEAIALITPFLNRNGSLAQARYTLAKAYLVNEKYKAARQQFRHILSMRQQFADTHFYLGVCEYNLQNCTAASHAFVKAIRINPYYGEAYYYLGLTLLLNAILGQEYDLALNLPDRTKKVFSKAVEIDSALKGNAVLQGLQLIEKEQFEQAFDILAPLADQFEKKNRPDIINYEFRLKALLETECIKAEQAWQEIQRLERLLPKYPKYPDLQYEIGLAYTVFGASVAATSLDHFRQAVRLNPEYKNALKGVKLVQTDQRGYHAIIRALMKTQ